MEKEDEAGLNLYQAKKKKKKKFCFSVFYLNFGSRIVSSEFLL